MVAMLKTTDQTEAASSFSQSAALITPSSAMPPRKEVDLNTYPGRCAQRLRELRESSGHSVEFIAETLDVTVQTIYRWERGDRVPDLKYFPMLASLYGLTNISDLLSRH